METQKQTIVSNWRECEQLLLQIEKENGESLTGVTTCYSLLQAPITGGEPMGRDAGERAMTHVLRYLGT
jgi:hypothetical protein